MKEDISKDEILDDENTVSEKEEKKKQKKNKNVTKREKENANVKHNDNQEAENVIEENNNIKQEVEEKETQNLEPKRIKIPLAGIILFLIILISCIITAAIYFFPLNK